MKVSDIKVGATYDGKGAGKKVVAIKDGWVEFHYAFESPDPAPYAITARGFASWARTCRPPDETTTSIT